MHTRGSVRHRRAAVGVAIFAGLMLAGSSLSAGASPMSRLASGSVTGADGKPSMSPEVKPLPPLVTEWQQDREQAADIVARNPARNRNGRVRLRDGTFVDYELQGTDNIITLLAEFTDPQAGQIAEPDRSVDNSTYWIPNFDRQHYQDELFAPGGGSYGRPSMSDYYLQQSSGRYTVEGQVSEWVQIDAPESEFGANSADGDGSDNLNGPVYRVVQAALNATASVDEGIDWSTADATDRYDCDADGNFDEPDGYVDHFQIVHAGQGEEEGGGAQGGDAIWSHRWYANFSNDGTTGPATCPLGGYQVPGTDLWVGDYTIEPENAGVGVFAHEFAHDLGLPDMYDTAGGPGNGTGFWTLMSSGSWADATDPNAIGTSPVHMGSWEKLALGWLDFAEVNAGDKSLVQLGPAEGTSTSGAQALRIQLPDYEFTQELIPPEPGDPDYYYSGSGDNLDVTMRRALDAPLAADATLTFRTWYQIEQDWDYAYVIYSTDGGGTWLNADGDLSTDANPNGQNFGNGITGSSGGWVSGTYTIPTGATDIGFRYWTDGAVAEPGFIVDTIAIGDFTDDGSDPGWSLDGFSVVVNGQVTNTYFNYYLVESRSYVRNDVNLRGAYNFITGNWLEKEPYANGLLVWYRNSRFEDNNTSQHPGGGQILVVDARPQPNVSPVGGDYFNTRWQTWDATFGVDLHKVRLTEVDDQGAWITRRYVAWPRRWFVDSSTTAYFDDRIPQNSVMTAGSGVFFTILGISPHRSTYRIWVSSL